MHLSVLLDQGLFLNEKMRVFKNLNFVEYLYSNAGQMIVDATLGYKREREHNNNNYLQKQLHKV